MCHHSRPSNKPLEWTGRHIHASDASLSLPATQGQRWADGLRALLWSAAPTGSWIEGAAFFGGWIRNASPLQPRTRMDRPCSPDLTRAQRVVQRAVGEGGGAPSDEIRCARREGQRQRLDQPAGRGRGSARRTRRAGRPPAQRLGVAVGEVRQAQAVEEALLVARGADARQVAREVGAHAL